MYAVFDMTTGKIIHWTRFQIIAWVARLCDGRLDYEFIPRNRLRLERKCSSNIG